jgi:SpoVK/Ycf46/Vps4 family AAA+-type ATPase
MPPPPLPTPRDELQREFRRALEDCEALYRESADLCLRDHPEVVARFSDDFAQLMEDLQHGLVIKIFVEVARVDWKWSVEERQLARDLVRHVWGQQLKGDRLRDVIQHINQQASELRWTDLVRPFAKIAPLQDRVGDLEAVILRLANLVAKIDGRLSQPEEAYLRDLQRELERYLDRPIRMDASHEHERQDRDTERAVTEMRESADLLRDGYSRKSRSGKKVDRGTASTGKASDQDQRDPREVLEEALAELDGLIGLANIKHEVHTLVNFIKIQERRKQHGLPVSTVSLHMVFLGNPGTGKTTVARIVGRIFGALGILAKGHLIETDRSGIVAEYAGQTGPKTNKKIDESMDGILFVDEAYSLVAEKGDDPYGHEAVQALLKRMEDDRKRLVIILAGYDRPMERLLKSNPGLSSRVSRKMAFPDFSAPELGQIFELMCEKQRYRLPAASRAKLLLGFQFLLERRDEHFGNGRLVRNVFENTIRRLANRLAPIAELTQELLTTLLPEDIAMPGVPEDVWDDFDEAVARVRARCPECGHAAMLRHTYLGHRVRCKACEHRFRVCWGEVVRG